MRFAFGILLSFTVVGCAHVDRERALATTAWDVMTDAEIAHAAVAEALGELHLVDAIDGDGLVVKGTSSFGSREERLTYERRVDAIVRAQVYGQGPTLELVHVRCEQLQRAGWAGWPGDERLRRSACEYGELTVHSLYKKPMLQRALVDLMLTAANDPLLAGQVKRKLLRLERTGVEPYLFIVQKWERVEGFRPRTEAPAPVVARAE
jgi:hypothetical protein